MRTRTGGPEPSRALLLVLLIDLFYAGEEWAKLRRPGAEEFVRLKLKRVSDWLGDREWLEANGIAYQREGRRSVPE